MAEDELQQAIAAIKAKNFVLGQSLLTNVIKQQPESETAWLWLAAIQTSDERKIYCLKKALQINPSNQKAKEALMRLSPHIDEPTPAQQSVIPFSKQQGEEAVSPPPAPKEQIKSPIISTPKKNTWWPYAIGLMALVCIMLVVIGGQLKFGPLGQGPLAMLATSTFTPTMDVASFTPFTFPSTWTPTTNPPTATKVSTSTPEPTSTPLPPTPTLPYRGMNAIEANDQNYPRIDPLDFYSNPQKYFTKRFQLNGYVTQKGTISDLGFIIQFFPIIYVSKPAILVFNFDSNINVNINQLITVYGSGGQLIHGTTASGSEMDFPVIYGEWVVRYKEDNLPPQGVYNLPPGSSFYIP